MLHVCMLSVSNTKPAVYKAAVEPDVPAPPAPLCLAIQRQPYHEPQPFSRQLFTGQMSWVQLAPMHLSPAVQARVCCWQMLFDLL
jgi:hypothetical protein